MHLLKLKIMTSLYKDQKSIPDFIVFLFIASLLVIDFFPNFNAQEVINPQFLYLAIVNTLAGIYFYFNNDRIASDLFSIFKKSYVLKIYAGFLFLCALSYITAKNTSLVFTRITELLIVFYLFLNLCILLKGKLGLLYKIAFIICISSFFQSFIQLKNFLIISKNSNLILLLQNMRGNTGNINILAASLTIKVPFILFAITYFKSFRKWFLLITLFSTISVILLSGARAPYISLTLIFLTYIVYLLREYSFQKSTYVKIITVIIPVLISLVFVSGIFDKAKDKGRYVSIEQRVKQMNTEDASASARLNYWKNAIQISEKNPILGIGLGNYQVESIPYERLMENDFYASLHAHNDFLEICSETGILNAVIYLSLFIWILITNIKKIAKSKDSETKAIALLSLLVVIAYGIDSLFNFPMYRPTMQIFFALLLALTVINSENTHAFHASNSNYKIVYIILIVAGLLTSYSAFLINKASKLEFLIKLDDINLNEKGHLTGDEVIKRMPLYPNVFNSSESFYEYAGIYYVREKNYEKALNCFSKASKINPYLGRIDFYKYVISIAKGDIDSAYVYSQRGFYLRPRSSHLYKTALYMAQVKKDTAEIFKVHALYSKYTITPDAWTLAATALQSSNVDQTRLIKFIDEGLKVLPKDSTLLKRKNDFLITGYIIKGQNLIAQSKFAQALQVYKDGLKLDSKNIEILQNLGFYYYDMKKDNEAIYYFKEALKYPGFNNGKTEYFIGICYLRMKDKVNACKYINLAIDKKFPQAFLLNQFCK